MKNYTDKIDYTNNAIKIITCSEKEFKGGMCELEDQITYLGSVKFETEEDNNEAKQVLESLLNFKNNCLLDYIYSKKSECSIGMPKFLIKVNKKKNKFGSLI